MVKQKYENISELQTYPTYLQKFAFKLAIFLALGVCMYGVSWGLLRLFQTENLQSSSPSMSFRQNDFKCFDKLNSFKIEQRGSFWVLQNYIRPSRWFRCDESVTLAIVGDPISLARLPFLVERWRGPVSLALYTPMTDMEAALLKIKYLRICSSPLIAELVTFHFYFERDHRPPIIPQEDVGLLIDEGAKQKLCSATSPWRQLNITDLYRKQKVLQFPINVGRNVARNAATTHFILSSDMKLYPSENFIPSFLAMIKRDEYFLRATKRSIFVLPTFEVSERTKIPSNKTELVSLFEKRTAFILHNQSPFQRYSIPEYEGWLKEPIQESLRAFHITKRKEMWEPYFIGTNQDPYYDERLTWEGKCDRLTQAYSMCLLNFDYHILNNAFLVQNPAKEQYERNPQKNAILKGAKMLIKNDIVPELNAIYGVKESCWLNT